MCRPSVTQKLRDIAGIASCPLPAVAAGETTFSGCALPIFSSETTEVPPHTERPPLTVFDGAAAEAAVAVPFVLCRGGVLLAQGRWNLATADTSRVMALRKACLGTGNISMFIRHFMERRRRRSKGVGSRNTVKQWHFFFHVAEVAKT